MLSGVDDKYFVHFQVLKGVNEIFGSDPYKGLGLFRDRDEVFLKAKCRF